MSIWSVLGIEPTGDVPAIKRAYAARSREVHPEDSPEDFRILHEAYLAALAFARRDEAPQPAPAYTPVPAAEAEAVSRHAAAEISGEKSSGYRDMVVNAALEENAYVNAAVVSALTRLEELAASKSSKTADYVAVLGSAVTLGTRQTRVCFLSAFAAALAEFIKAREKLPDRLYEAVTLVYEFSPKLAPSPAKDLQQLYNVLRERKRLMTIKERRLEKLSSFFILAPFLVILCQAIGNGIKSDASFFFMVACMVTILVSACIVGVKNQKGRAPGPYSAELQKLRRRRSLL